MGMQLWAQPESVLRKMLAESEREAELAAAGGDREFAAGARTAAARVRAELEKRARRAVAA